MWTYSDINDLTTISRPALIENASYFELGRIKKQKKAFNIDEVNFLLAAIGFDVENFETIEKKAYPQDKEDNCE